MNILNIINELADNSSSKTKLEILKKHQNNDLLKRCFYLALSPRIKFYIKNIPSYKSDTLSYYLETSLGKLSILYTRQQTGIDAINFLKDILTYSFEDDAIIIERIIGKDLKCGVNVTTANKIWKGLIEETPYMGAISFNKKKAQQLFDGNGVVVSQEKMDGRYCNTIISDTVVHEARSGEITYLDNTFDFLLSGTLKDVVLNGELIINGVDRYTSNGMIASIVFINKKKQENKPYSSDCIKFFNKYQVSVNEAANQISLVCWDIIDLNEYFAGYSDIIYAERFKRLKDFITEINNPRVRLVDSRIVESLEDALTDFNLKISENKEGTIIKSLSGKWKDGKPNWQQKIKLEMSVDLKISGFKQGTKGTRLEDTLGSLIVESSDGLLQTDPAGISDEMRDYIWANQDSLLGSIVEIKSCGTSRSKTSDIYALLHPRFIKLRDDKLKANTLSEILEIENSLKIFK